MGFLSHRAPKGAIDVEQVEREAILDSIALGVNLYVSQPGPTGIHHT